jgi:hypothetical protein
MSKITVAIKRPNENSEVVEVDNTLKTFQEFVGGYIEVVPFTEDGDILVICDEEGKMKGKDFNLRYYEDILVGTLVFVKNGDDGEFHSLESDDLLVVNEIIKNGGVR